MMRLLVALQIAAMYVLPTIMLSTNLIPVYYRYWLFGIGMLIPILEMILRRWPLQKIGFRSDTFVRSLVPYGIFTSAFALGLFILAWLLGRNPLRVSAELLMPSSIFFIILLSFFQELCFRGYLRNKLREVTARADVQLIVNALLFASFHVIYPEPLLSVSLTFIAGMGFSAMYERYPNLWAIGLSHAVLNFVSISFCFVSLMPGCMGQSG